jgi:hypothetical protein
MEKTIDQETGMPEKKKTGVFNFNKLQAVLCIAASAAVSIALIVWLIR